MSELLTELQFKYSIREIIPLTSDKINIYIKLYEPMNVLLKAEQNINLNIPIENLEE